MFFNFQRYSILFWNSLLEYCKINVASLRHILKEQTDYKFNALRFQLIQLLLTLEIRIIILDIILVNLKIILISEIIIMSV